LRADIGTLIGGLAPLLSAPKCSAVDAGEEGPLESPFSRLMISSSFTSADQFLLTCILAALAVLALSNTTVQAQLIDPNNRCVYQPGSTTCQPLGPAASPKPSGPPYKQFLDLAANSNIKLSQHSTYTQDYFNERSRIYCSLLQRGELMKITQEVQFPPVVHFTETTHDRPRLEVAILRIGTMNFCPTFWNQEQQWEVTFVR